MGLKANLKQEIKNKLISKLSEFAGHTGIAGGQFLDLDFEKKNIPFKKISKRNIRLFEYS